ncbi:MAG: hypothetical protein JWM47_3926 [Acidimicrobiales bacterium]|nr:hypothetical protein [Acidimicrobiales bacterium]
MAETSPLQELLPDAFGRVRESVASTLDGITDRELTDRPDADANSVAWLVWHLSRIQDDHIAGLAGVEQVWTAEGWADRFGLPFDPSDTGYGHDAAQVAAVRAGADPLGGYHEAVHEATTRYIHTVDAAELARVVDESWDPPVTASVRLVSVLGDTLQHVGQAAYARGLAERS